MKKKKVVILGSTGSIGKSALDVIRRHKKNFQVLGLSAHRSVDLLKKQIKEFVDPNHHINGIFDPNVSMS